MKVWVLWETVLGAGSALAAAPAGRHHRGPPGVLVQLGRVGSRN